MMKVLRDAATEANNGEESGRHEEEAVRPEAVRTARDMVKIIYKEVPVSLHDAVERAVVQILRKLLKEGKVKRTEEGKWQLVPSKQHVL